MGIPCYESKDCDHRAELIWREINKFVSYLRDQPKSKQPQHSSFQILLQVVEDPYMWFSCCYKSHLMEKSRINYQIVHLPSCMGHVYIANKNTVENCTLKLVFIKRITSNIGDDATEQFLKMISEVIPKSKGKFLEFNKLEHRLDTFSQFLLEKCYESLWKNFVVVFCLLHGQAAIECGNQP